MRIRRQPSGDGRFGRALRFAAHMVSAVLLTAVLFLVLPLMQHVSRDPVPGLDLREVSTVPLPPPPPTEEEPPRPRRETPPPELVEVAPLLDLNAIELALDPGLSDELGGDFAVRLPGMNGGTDEDPYAVFSMAELDQRPRLIYQPAPEYPPDLRRRSVEGTVYVLFVVDQTGRTTHPIVQTSTHPAFERPALRAVRRWRFEPGTRNGKPVHFKMRVPITFVSS